MKYKHFKQALLFKVGSVFNLNSDNTGYYSTIEMLYDMWNMDKSKSLKEMISSFEHKMDSHLSAQMEAFLISKYVKNHAR